MHLLRRQNPGLTGFAPVNAHLIDTNLYLGTLGAATSLKTLERYKITHILTIEDAPLPDFIQRLEHITTKFIQLSDQPKSDLLSHFEDTYNFICEGVSKGAVLVHCFFGVSRSATVVIAYMMKTYKLSDQEALERVQKSRNQVYPNAGFICQLGLYYKMGYKLDSQNRENKLYRLRAAAEQVRKLKIVPEAYLDVIKPNPGLNQNQVSCQCKKCGRVLASDLNVIPHKYREECKKTYFLEPLAWMKVTESVGRDLHCPGCGKIVGGFNWLAGYRCACDFKMAPAFYLNPLEISVKKNTVK